MEREMADEVENVLDEVVRPWLARHSGDIWVEDMDTDGRLKVRLSGPCAGCPAADLEVTTFVTDELRARLPEISEVVLLSGVSDDLMSQARALLALRVVGARRALPVAV